jgi:hypothetical protein
MKFTIDSQELPSYVKGRPREIVTKWVEIFNQVCDSNGPELAFIVSNKWLTKYYTDHKYVKRCIISLDVDSSQKFISRSDDGEEYVTLVLGSTEPHKDGMIYSEELLKKWEGDINQGKLSIGGDLDHELYDKLLDSGLSDETIRKELKSKPSIAKAFKAIYENGKLFLRAMIDKRYRKIINESKGVSAEAFVKMDKNKAIDGELLGFSFNVKTTPADNFAGVLA